MPLAVALFFVGCKGKAACKTDVDELMAVLNGREKSMPLYWDDDIKPVERTDLPKKQPQAAAPIVIIGSTVRFEGSVVDPPELEYKLKAARERRYWKPADPTEVVFVIDGNAKWSVVADCATGAAGAGFTRLTLAFGLPSTVKPPPRVAVDDKLDQILKDPEGGNKATELANLMSKIVKDCKPLKKAFGAVGSEEGGDKAQILIDAMGPALLECNCDVDIPALRNAFFAIVNNPHPTTIISVELVKGGKQIALPAATPWREAQKQLADAAAVWLSAS